jgi:major membrane immunogen (membrane-anchored lipoprotein)
MSWLKGGLIALGIVVVLVIAIVAALGLLSSGGGHEVRHISVGQRTITVSHYKNMTQESIADGVKIVTDGHIISVTPDALTIDGNAQSFDPAQDVEIDIDEKGAIEAKALGPDTAPSDTSSPDDDGSDAPPQ